MTRYAHLSAVAAGLQVGDTVRAGRVVGFVGESGQLEAITAPGTDWHLHFEIRVAEGYLGEGLVPPLARARYVESFGFGPAVVPSFDWDGNRVAPFDSTRAYGLVR